MGQTISDYEVEQTWFPCSEAILDWGEEFHTLLLNDRIRMVAYETAIKEAVKPGSVVLDLGTGTGILAFWALEAGASRVYGIDLSKDVLQVAVDRMNRAGFGDRFKPLNALSYDVQLPERVDLIISEILGNIGDNEDFTNILNDAKKRFLKPDGKMLPSRVETYLVPVAAEKAHSQLSRGVCQGTKEPLEQVLARSGITSAFNVYYDTIIPRSTYLATPRVVRVFSMDGNDAATYEMSLTYTAERDGLLTGFKGYFIADLSETVALDISGDDIARRTTSDSWKHAFFPIRIPLEVKQGDRICLNFSRSYPERRDTPFRQIYRWEGKIMRGLKHAGHFKQNIG